MFFNINGYRNLDEFLCNFSTIPEILCLNETWLLSEPNIYPKMLSGHKGIHSLAVKDHSFGRGSGGLLIFCHKSYECTVLNVSPWWIIIRVSLGHNLSIIVCSVYFKPSLPLESAIELLQATLTEICGNFDNPILIIGGDFNGRVSNLNCAPSELFAESNLMPARDSLDSVCNTRGCKIVEFMEVNSLTMMNGRTPRDSPGCFTFVGSQGRSVVDLVWCSNNSLLLVNDFEVQHVATLSDHFPVLLTLDIPSPDFLGEDPPSTAVVPCWKANLEQDYKSWMLYSPRTQVNHYSPELMYDNFRDAILEAVDVIGLKRTVCYNNGHHQRHYWYDGECRAAKGRLQQALRRCRISGFVSPYSETYLSLKKEYRLLIKSKKRSGLFCYIDELSNSLSSSEFWDRIRQYRLVRVRPGPSMSEWETFFEALYSPVIPPAYELYFSDARHPLLDGDFTLEEISSALRKCKTGKTPGKDGITVEFIKGLPDNWMLYLVALFNRIYTTACVPQDWREMTLTMIFKKGSRDDPSNYRGIAITNIAEKLFSQVLLHRLSRWSENNDILPECQSGFRPGRSCSDNVFVLSSVIQMHLRLRGRKVYAAFIDFQRAFDSVDHSLLWFKLFSIGVSSMYIRWLKNLYHGAKFRVKTFGKYSKEFYITQGVLQGEPSSPLLFALFLSDIERYFIERGAKGLNIDGFNEVSLLMYADDLVLLSDSPVDMNKKLSILYQYTVENKLKVNISKSKIMCFRRGGYGRDQDVFWFNNLPLEVVNEYLYLGVLFSSSSLFLRNTHHVIEKTRVAIGSVMHILSATKTTSWHVRIKLYNSIVLNSFSHCSAIWALRYTNLLERVQVSFFKQLLCLPRNTPDYMVRIETGSSKLSVTCLSLALSFLINILTLPQDRLPRLCLERLVALDGTEHSQVSFNWVSQIKSLLSYAGCEVEWNAQNLICQKDSIIELVKQKLYEDDVSRLENSSFSTYYRSLSLSRLPAEYLLFNLPIKYTRILSQLRLCNMNKMRFSIGAIAYVIDSASVCTICNMNEPETLEHVLLRCPLYSCVRPDQITGLRSADNLPTLLNNLTPALVKTIFYFLMNCFKIRAFITDE